MIMSFNSRHDRYGDNNNDKYWETRKERSMIAEAGSSRLWAHSPTRDELKEMYKTLEHAAKQAEEKTKEEEKLEKRRKKESKKAKKADRESRKKEKKHKKKHKKRRKQSSSSSVENDSSEHEEEWVEMTKEIRQKVEEQQKAEDSQIIGPQIPEHLLKQNEVNYFELDATDRKNMPRGEAAAMAAYAAQGKRIPRRGEIGLSSDEISNFEVVGYVMSGTRHKSMEATRLRKENQIMTAEEKRLLSGFTQEQRKEKEDAVMTQFQNLISSKRQQ